ncbi:AP-3 complex subunit delta [Coemansia thaxteri]|uniref:AP-3 complex subunit delta n=1 Tax=Coemansia thaxteri TaxID=2663907 RepID=A0A9W8BIK4_9FUNG|nr:AP-3 complex subunit delta [Coemansia thaxteri]KAJ2002384.1 AP-3 complex subunit delta [Coemansia thaxteri]KAJ2472286.1 AP-3 complex subunit delta [Coemansia sp. RSA 2322]
MFEKSLSDLIQGLRANKRNEVDYIQKSLEEIQSEVQLSDMRSKSTAIDKLNYLHMLGYDTNWANFNVVEVMASPRFGEKRTGYLAAAQSFHQETDVLMLATNLIRKDLSSSNVMEVSVALDGLAQVATPELATDLFDDATAVLGHSRPFIRKKALVCLYRLVLKHPEGLHALAPQLRERLDDPDPSVVSSAVSVICELARTNPTNYLPLAPKLYHLLNSSTNNWMLIKIVKLFASLTPIEPRLAKKLHGPLSQLICTTSAMSLLYECIHTAVVGDIIGVSEPVADSVGREIELAELCARKLTLFYESTDHNLRYVGLVTLAQLQARRPELVVGQYETVLKCLDDPDLSIRTRALSVISGMATRRTLARTVKRLMSQLILSNTIRLQPACNMPGVSNSEHNGDAVDFNPGAPTTDGAGTSLVNARGSIMQPRQAAAAGPAPADSPEYRLMVVESIVDMCTRQSYANLVDFEWYVAALVDLVYTAGVDVGRMLGEKLLDVTVRVRQVREFSIKLMRRLLSDRQLVSYASAGNSTAKVLCAAAYILGEYCTLLPANSEDVSLLFPPCLSELDGDEQATFIQAAIKVYANWLRDVTGYWGPEVWELVREVNASTMRQLTGLLLARAGDGSDEGVHLSSVVAELPLQVDCRLRHFVEITKAVSVATSNLSDSAPQLCQELHELFTAYELNPVSAAAQGKVPLPDGLDLDTAIGCPIPDTTHILFPPPPPAPSVSAAQPRQRDSQPSKDSSNGRRPRRGSKNDPFYLDNARDSRDLAELPDVDDIPVVHLDLGGLGDAPKPRKSGKKKSGKGRSLAKHSRKNRTKSPRSPSPSPPPPAPVEIAGDEDMPDTDKR